MTDNGATSLATEDTDAPVGDELARARAFLAAPPPPSTGPLSWLFAFSPSADDGLVLQTHYTVALTASEPVDEGSVAYEWVVVRPPGLTAAGGGFAPDIQAHGYSKIFQFTPTVPGVSYFFKASAAVKGPAAGGTLSERATDTYIFNARLSALRQNRSALLIGLLVGVGLLLLMTVAAVLLEVFLGPARNAMRRAREHMDRAGVVLAPSPQPLLVQQMVSLTEVAV